jgi:lysozyme
MTPSNNCLNLIKGFEGIRLKAYQCSAGIWTIGYGHTSGVKQGDICTIAEAEKYFADDLKIVWLQITQLGLNINQNQLDALCSFIFNVGITAFKNSNLFKKIKGNPSDVAIKTNWLMWNKIRKNGQLVESEGLTIRRSREIELYFT